MRAHKMAKITYEIKTGGSVTVEKDKKKPVDKKAENKPADKTEVKKHAS